MKRLVIFTEEESAKALLNQLLPRLLPRGVTYHCIAFEGKQDLEKQLPIKLRGWRHPNTQFLIMRDQDLGDCKSIKKDLQCICRKAGKPNILIRIVCRELESWFLADLAAVEAALDLPGLAKQQDKAQYRKPDRLPVPSKELRKITRERYQKVSGSRAIGNYLDLENTRSTSFRHFVLGVRRMYMG